MVERGYRISSPGIFALNESDSVAMRVRALDDSDLERTVEGRGARQVGQVRFGERQAAESERTIIENGLAGSDVAYRRDHRTFTAARRTLAFAWRRRGPGDLSVELPNNFADGFFQGDPVL